MTRLVAGAALAAVVCLVAGPVLAQAASIVSIDRLIDHISTMPAIAGQKIDLFLREKVAVGLLENGPG